MVNKKIQGFGEVQKHEGNIKEATFQKTRMPTEVSLDGIAVQDIQNMTNSKI